MAEIPIQRKPRRQLWPLLLLLLVIAVIAWFFWPRTPVETGAPAAAPATAPAPPKPTSMIAPRGATGTVRLVVMPATPAARRAAA